MFHQWSHSRRLANVFANGSAGVTADHNFGLNVLRHCGTEEREDLGGFPALFS